MSDEQNPYGQYGRQQEPQMPYRDPVAQDACPQDAYPQDPHAHDPYSQSWDGQTWDTQYQPVQQPTHQQSYQQHPPQQPQPQAAEPVYLRPRSHPLPPEAPTPMQTPSPAPALPATDGPAYNAPSTVGTARVTDAQRARAEGRSPIIAPGMQSAGLTAGLGLLIAVVAVGGRYAVVVPLLVLQALTAAGWFRLNGMWPARQGIALAFAGGVVADTALLVAGPQHGPAAIIGTLGVWVLLTLVLQLRSHASPDERMAGLTATIAASAFTIVAAGLLATSMDAVAVGGIAVAAAVIARALPFPGTASVVIALLAAAGAGILAGALTDLGTQSALLGFTAGGCALIGLRVASYDYPSRFVHMTAGVALPLTAAVPAIYLIGRVVG